MKSFHLLHLLIITSPLWEAGVILPFGAFTKKEIKNGKRLSSFQSKNLAIIKKMKPPLER